MKRFFSLSFITLALLISAVGAAPTALAENHTVEDQLAANEVAEPYTGDNYPTDNGASVMNDINAANAISQASDKPAPKEGDPNSPYNSVMQKILELFAWLLGVSAITLNYAVYYTVVVMGAYVKNLSAIGVTWTILRDIGNIFLIFGFLAVGVTTILNVDWYGKGTKMLPMMFIAAVFLNFSLFFTEAIIDTGNIFATQFYKQINNGNFPNPPALTLASVTEEGISNKIMNQLGLQTIYGNGTVNPAIYKANSPWLIGFMGILLFIVTAFVFFTLSFILVARFVILIFLIILAPIGFAGLAVPMLAKRAGQWWDKLFEQTITAPILLLMLYVALRVITDVQFISGFGPAGALANGASTGFVGNANLGGFGSFVLSFVVAMGLLLAVVIQSKNLSAFGASWASKTAGALTFGAVGWASRRTVGRLATASASRFRDSKYARSNIGRLFAGGLDTVAKGSYDIRGATAFGGLQGIKGVDAGKAQEGGYAKIKEDAIDVRLKYAKTLNLTKEEEAQVKKLELDQVRLEEDVKKTNEELSDINADIKQAKKEGRSADVARLETAKKVNEKVKEDQEKQLKDKKESLTRAKNIPQMQYAEGMQRWSKIGGPESVPGKVLSVPYQLLVGPAANKVASGKLLKEAKKSIEEKELDSFRSLLAKAGTTPSPAPPPPSAPPPPPGASGPATP